MCTTCYGISSQQLEARPKPTSPDLLNVGGQTPIPHHLKTAGMSCYCVNFSVSPSPGGFLYTSQSSIEKKVNISVSLRASHHTPHRTCCRATVDHRMREKDSDGDRENESGRTGGKVRTERRECCGTVFLNKSRNVEINTIMQLPLWDLVA